MQPLEYKNIGGNEHLTFDSIRRLVLHELSELSGREAAKHIESCERCRGIYQSLAKPDEIRQSHAKRPVVRPMIVGVLLVMVLVAAAASILYFGSESKPVEHKKADTALPLGAEIEEFPESQQEIEKTVAPILEAIDTLSQINEEPEVEPQLPTNKQFDQYIEKEQVQPRIRLRGIYGKITADGQPLPGVTVKVPGSNSSRVSDDGGKYYIQVPRNTKSLVFIHHGKQLIKNLDPNSRRLDIHLKSESLSYPEAQEGQDNVES
jgi:hypothetical protein